MTRLRSIPCIFGMGLWLVALLGSKASMAAPIAIVFDCSGCVADNGTGYDMDACSGTNWSVEVTTTPTDGECSTSNGECESSPCIFKLTFEWRLPGSASVDVCNSYNGTRYCLVPAPVANGSPQSHPYDLYAGCDETEFRVSTGGSSPCGPLLASNTVSCSSCED